MNIVHRRRHVGLFIHGRRHLELLIHGRRHLELLFTLKRPPPEFIMSHPKVQN